MLPVWLLVRLFQLLLYRTCSCVPCHTALQHTLKAPPASAPAGWLRGAGEVCAGECRPGAEHRQWSAGARRDIVRHGHEVAQVRADRACSCIADGSVVQAQRFVTVHGDIVALASRSLRRLDTPGVTRRPQLSLHLENGICVAAIARTDTFTSDTQT
jgi:hypothetical protein